MLFDWLTTCIAVERYVSIVQGISFKKSVSVWWAKRVVASLIIAVVTSSWHELFSHQLIEDP
jgi:hypothetical protein